MLSISLIPGEASPDVQDTATFYPFVFARTDYGGKGGSKAGTPTETRWCSKPSLHRSIRQPGEEQSTCDCMLCVEMSLFLCLWFCIEVRQGMLNACVFVGQAGPSEEGDWWAELSSALFGLFQKFLICQKEKKRLLLIKNSKTYTQTLLLLEKPIPDCLVHKGSSVH